MKLESKITQSRFKTNLWAFFVLWERSYQYTLYLIITKKRKKILLSHSKDKNCHIDN